MTLYEIIETHFPNPDGLTNEQLEDAVRQLDTAHIAFSALLKQRMYPMPKRNYHD